MVQEINSGKELLMSQSNKIDRDTIKTTRGRKYGKNNIEKTKCKIWKGI